MTYKDNKKSILFGSKEGYDMYADNYDYRLKFLDSFERDGVFRMLGDIKGKKVLDVGCGTGRVIARLHDLGAEVFASDISGEMLKITKKKFKDIEVVSADIEALPFKNESFDCVIALFVIVHLKDLEKAFEEVYRVLKNGGIFIVSNVNQRKPPKLKLKNGEEILIKSFYHMPKNVISALEGALFKIEKEEFVYEKDIWINQIIKAVK